jgi:hypothetical protein
MNDGIKQDYPSRTFPIEEFITILSGERERFGKFSNEFNNLGDVIVVFAVLGARLRIKEVIASSEKFENL